MVMGHGCLGLSVRKGKCRAACIFDFRRPLFGFLQSQLFRTDHLLEINTEKRIRGCFSLVHRDSSCRPLKQRSVVAERKRSRSPSMSSLLSRLRLVTVDVTGTLIAYRGQLGDYYCMAAKSAGMPCPDYGRVHEGFKLAYADMSRRHPCFGHAAAMPTADWWKTCVTDSFVRAGYGYDETFERIFRRIYSTFGSSAPYAVFPDAQRFLRWLRKEGLVVGIVSNAEHRYRDVVLPALGLNQWDFGVFSGVVGVEKPDPRIYEAALQQAAAGAGSGSVAPGEALHIGDSLRKDYAPARSLGMHALLLDRFLTADAECWRRSGALVLPDLVAAQEWLPGGHSHREEAADQPVTAR